MDGTLYTAQPLGLNSNNQHRVDNTLPGYSLTTLGQSYLQYENSLLSFQGGNQILTTPWINASDSRMIPATYQTLYGKITPNNNLTVTLLP